MEKEDMRQNEEIVKMLRRMESTLFASQLPVRPVMLDCSCQNCGCDSRAGDSCGCDPRCSCQGYTALDGYEPIMDAMLGVASVLPLEDVKTMIELKNKMKTPKKG